MKKIKKILKILLKDWPLLIAVVFTIFLQAYCELTLPEYTSSIVNVGIQQSGVETHVPTPIRTGSMQQLMHLMSEEDTAKIGEYYTRTDDDHYYILNEMSKDEKPLAIAELEEVFGIPMMISFLTQNGSENMGESSSFAIPMDNIDFSSPDAVAQIREMLSSLDSSLINQVAIQYTTSEYQAIGIDLQQLRTDYMRRVGLIMVGYALLALASTCITVFITSRVGTRFARDTRSAVFGHILKFSDKEFDKFSTATLITRSTNDVQQVQGFLTMMLRMLLFCPIMGFGALSKVLSGGYSLAWIIGVAVVLVMVVLLVLLTAVMPKFQILQKMVDKINLISREILTGLPVIRAFSREEHERKRFDIANLDLTKISIFVNRAMSIIMPLLSFIMNGMSILIVWYGSIGVDAGTMQVGDLLALISYSMYVIMSFLFIAMISVALPRALISARRLAEILDVEISVSDEGAHEKFSGKNKGVLEFKDVSYRYDNAEEDVLQNITFTSNPGETTAIIGSTGSGKSTLVNLIPRFNDVTQGEILLDGVNIKDVSLHDLRARIGYVPQKAVLLSGTIKSNIAYSDANMSDENIRLAAGIAQATEFIENKEDKFDSGISQGGTNVSGGQKQRLSIARAIAKNPEVYIFDDSFSALDYKTDITLRKALSNITKQSTVLIVAQRISTVLGADKIIVLDEGRIAGIGKHSELMENCEVYRDIAYSQLSEQELNRKGG